MSNTSGRLIQVAQAVTNGQPIRLLETGEFGMKLDENQEELFIGSRTGNIQVVTERNIAQLAVPDHSIGRLELTNEINDLLDQASTGSNIDIATDSNKGLMSGEDKSKLDGIQEGATKTEIVNTLTSLSTTSALSAYQGRVLKQLIDDIVAGGGVVDNLTSSDTDKALSANQGRVLKQLIDSKPTSSTATQSSNGLMTSSDKQKLDSIQANATNTVIINNLTSDSTTSALSARQGKVLKDLIDSTVNNIIVVRDNLTSTERTNALSANQGRVLKNLIDSKASNTIATRSVNGLMSASDKAKLDNIPTGGGSTVQVINTLTSSSTTSALSANQGRILNDKIMANTLSHISQTGLTTSTDSTSFGAYNNSSGRNSFTINAGNTTTGSYTFAGGSDNTASGYSSAALGRDSVASGSSSFTAGINNQAVNYASVAFGQRSNMTYGGDGFYTTADAFVIGNGSGSTRSNAFRVKFNGQVYGRAAYNSSGADYAEYLEWSDGNKNNEDRVGYFVTLDGDKIRKANSKDEYILGIISANASVIGNSASEGWNEQYVRDEFGRVQYHYVDVEHRELNDKGEKTIVIKKEYHPVYNPNYDPSKRYIPREERPEWDAVGMVGILLVRDDGSCQVNGYCKSNDEGIATKSDSGYRVMKRVSDNIVQVLVK